MNEKRDQNAVDPTPRRLPLACGLLTLFGAIAWNPAAIVLGLAVVGLWAPVAAALTSAADKLAAARLVHTVAAPVRTPPK